MDFRQEVLPGVPAEKIPRHIAIIMDGNGRWARERGLPREAGHRAGTNNIRPILEACVELGVEVLTLYAFSTENWDRPRAEVRALMRILQEVIDREVDELDRQGVQIRHLGRLEGVDDRLARSIRQAIERTKDNRRISLCVAFNYGGRQEIIDAVKRILEDGIPPDQITEELFESYLYTAGLPDPDLIIRTSGEMRLSNFLIWQSAYSEFYATETYWPAFDRREVERAILAYAGRKRKFGRLLPEHQG